jgi:hypothetical protein
MQTNSSGSQATTGIKLEVDREIWHHVPNLNDSASDDNHYSVKYFNDGTVVVFGDGKHGALPPTGKEIKITFYSNKQLAGVLLQQGRVQLNNDWNENKISSARYLGIYKGVVIDNIDPQSRLRLSVQIPSVLGTHAVWALPCIPVGTPVVPAIGKGVWVMFESGDPASPIWMGTWSFAE